MVAGVIDLQRINISKNIVLDAVEKSLCLRYAEVLALRKAVRKESSWQQRGPSEMSSNECMATASDLHSRRILIDACCGLTPAS
jgi:hypothetical protein